MQAENERMEKDNPCQWSPEENSSSNTNVRQNILYVKNCYKRQGHYISDKKVNSPRRYK